MRVRIQGSGRGKAAGLHFLTSFVIDDRVAIDAGAIGLNGDLESQSGIRDVVISHTHADHIATLPIFVENNWRGPEGCVTIHGHPRALSTLRRDVFNDRIWPDLERVGVSDAPFMRMTPIAAEKPFRIAHLEITPVRVNHNQPSLGFIIDDGSAAIVITSDTGPTDRLWELARRRRRLAGVFAEVSFPDEHRKLARVCKHLTPSLLSGEMQKLDRSVPVIAYHLKPRHRSEIMHELRRLAPRDVRVGRADEDYVF